MPGMSDLSMTPVLWKATDGTEYTELLDKLIDWGIDAHAKRKRWCERSNDTHFFRKIAEITDGEIPWPEFSDVVIEGIAYDSRKVEPGNLYVPLPGNG